MPLLVLLLTMSTCLRLQRCSCSSWLSRDLNLEQQQQQQKQGCSATDAAVAELQRMQASGIIPDSACAGQEPGRDNADRIKSKAVWEAAQHGFHGVRNVAAVLLIAAWVVAGRCSIAPVGSMLTYMITRQVVFLVGAADSWTAGHVDPAAAIAFAWVLQTSDMTAAEREQRLNKPLAAWLFISPSVFQDTSMLNKLLDALRQHGTVKDLAVLAAAGKPAQGAKTTSRQQRSKQAAKQQQQQKKNSNRKVQPLQQQLNKKKEQQQQQEKQKHNQSDRTKQQQQQSDRQHTWDALVDQRVELDVAGMSAVACELGEHAHVVEQKAGQGVWVPPGWLHWVYNSDSCFKITFDLPYYARRSMLPHAAARALQLRWG
ncbi:hypothetical protein COO60DRAFT_31227 [Scenedesmus sp. NREL 46B-D3]|nr:hypothetical protein COO60DRAFT_31227 [Scenedesmus sp. NREL 46B-D3]